MRGRVLQHLDREALMAEVGAAAASAVARRTPEHAVWVERMGREIARALSGPGLAPAVNERKSISACPSNPCAGCASLAPWISTPGCWRCTCSSAFAVARRARALQRDRVRRQADDDARADEDALPRRTVRQALIIGAGALVLFFGVILALDSDRFNIWDPWVIAGDRAVGGSPPVSASAPAPTTRRPPSRPRAPTPAPRPRSSRGCAHRTACSPHYAIVAVFLLLVLDMIFKPGA